MKIIKKTPFLNLFPPLNKFQLSIKVPDCLLVSENSDITVKNYKEK